MRIRVKGLINHYKYVCWGGNTQTIKTDLMKNLVSKCEELMSNLTVYLHTVLH